MKKPLISETIDEMKERFVREALRRTDGNRDKAAVLLGVTVRTVYAKISKYDIDVKNLN